MMGRKLIAALTPLIFCLMVAAALPAPAKAHSLRELEDQLTANDPYIQIPPTSRHFAGEECDESFLCRWY